MTEVNREEKRNLRLKDVEEIAKNWERIPPEARGELTGTVRTLHTIFTGCEKEAG